MIVSIVLLSLSFVAMFVWTIRSFDQVKDMPEREFLANLQISRSVSSDMHEHLIAPIVILYHNRVLPWFYEETEKAISRFRINLLKFETLLLKLANYIRGKRKICLGENASEYWKDINEFKSELRKVK